MKRKEVPAAAAAEPAVDLDARAREQDKIARQLLHMLGGCQDTVFHTELFNSKCPRICIPLLPVQEKSSGSSTTSAAAPAQTWADTVCGSAERKNNLLATILLASARRIGAQAYEADNFRNAYSWWFGNDESVSGEAVQRDVIRALNKSQAQIMARLEHLPRALAYIEDGKRLWMFFTDGRVNFSNLLCEELAGGGGAYKPLFSQEELQFAERDLGYDTNVRTAMLQCNEYTRHKLVLANLIRTSTQKEFEGVRVRDAEELGIEPHVAALRAFEPAERSEYVNAMGEATRSKFARVVCNSSVRTSDLLSWPAPAVRDDFIFVNLAKLRAEPSKTKKCLAVLEKYEAHTKRVRDALESGSVDAVEAAIDAESSVEAEQEQRQAEDVSARAKGSRDARNTLIEDMMREGKTQMTIEWHDEDIADFFDGNNDNPRVRVNINSKANNRDARFQVSAQNEDERANVRTFHGNLADVFGNVQDELAALNGGGLGALDATSDAARMHRSIEDANKELEKIMSMSATGAAMQAKFEQLNVFREYRRLNGKKLKSITETYAKDSQEYIDHMRDFKAQAITEASQAFFGTSQAGNRVSTPIQEVRAWLTKLPEQLPEMPVVSKEATPFGNFILQMMNDLEQAFTPGTAMEDMIFCVFSAGAAFWHHDGLRPNPLLHGGAAVGKSYNLRCVASLMPPGVCFAVTHETDKAGLVDGMRTDLLETVEEMMQHKLGTDEYGHEREASSTQKDRLTNIYRTTVTLEVSKDPETGEMVRRPRVFHSCEEMGRQYATNAKLPPPDNPLLTRYMLRNVLPSTDKDERIINKMNSLKANFDDDDVEDVRTQWRCFFSIQLFIEKMIESRAIADVNMDAMIEMKEMLEFVENKYKFSTNDPRLYTKMHSFARLVTVSYAIYLAVTSEAGAKLRYSDPQCTKPRTLADAALDIALAVEKRLVCTREIVVYVFSLLRSEWMPALRQEILQAVRDMVKLDTLLRNPLDESNKAISSSSSTASIAPAAAAADDSSMSSSVMSTSVTAQSGSKRTRTGETVRPSATPRSTSAPKNRVCFVSALHSELDNLYSQKYVDSSYVKLMDGNDSTKDRDVAKEIAKNIRHRTVGIETIMREMKDMSNVDVRAPIWVHDVQQLNARNDLRPMEVKNGTETVYQTKPLFFCGRLPYDAKIVANQNSHAAGAESSASNKNFSTNVQQQEEQTRILHQLQKIKNDLKTTSDTATLLKRQLELQNRLASVLLQQQQQQQQQQQPQQQKSFQHVSSDNPNQPVVNGAVADMSLSSSSFAGATYAHGDSRNNNNLFTCMILYDALLNPADHRSVVQEAVQSLTHRNMLNKKQTFLISQPTMVDVDVPLAFHYSEEDGFGAINPSQQVATETANQKSSGKKMQILTLYQVPSKITIERDDKVLRMMTNERPLLNYQMQMRQLFKRGKRGVRERRRLNMEGADSASWLLRTDPDHVATRTHFKNIGERYSDDHYWLCIQLSMQKLHEADFLPYVEREEMIEEHVNVWKEKSLVKLLLKQVKTPEQAEQVQQLLTATLGSVENVVNATRVITAHEDAIVGAKNVARDLREDNLRLQSEVEDLRDRLDHEHPDGDKERAQKRPRTHTDQLIFFERTNGRMLDAADSERLERANSLLRKSVSFLNGSSSNESTRDGNENARMNGLANAAMDDDDYNDDEREPTMSNALAPRSSIRRSTASASSSSIAHQQDATVLRVSSLPLAQRIDVLHKGFSILEALKKPTKATVVVAAPTTVNVPVQVPEITVEMAIEWDEQDKEKERQRQLEREREKRKRQEADERIGLRNSVLDRDNELRRALQELNQQQPLNTAPPTTDGQRDPYHIIHPTINNARSRVEYRVPSNN